MESKLQRSALTVRTPASRWHRFLAASAIILASLVLFAQVVGSKERAESRDLVNEKKISIATLIYEFDWDDMMPVGYQNRFSCLPLDHSQCNYRVMWHFPLEPYVPDWKIFLAPDELNLGVASVDSYDISYGYNYSQMSTLCLANDAYSQQHLGCSVFDSGSPSSSKFFKAVSFTSLENPAMTVFIGSGGGRDLQSASILGSLLEPPAAATDGRYHFNSPGVGWGEGCPNAYSKSSGARRAIWQTWNGYAPRYNNSGNVIFVDGRVAPMAPAALSSGTNFGPGVNCDQVIVTDVQNYFWDQL